MFFIYNPRPDSQAGRRGFEPRLPLHLFNNLASPVFKACSKMLQNLKTTSPAMPIPARPPLPCALPRKPAYRRSGSRRACARAGRPPFGIVMNLVHERRVRAPHDVEIHPAQTRGFKLRADMPAPEIVPQTGVLPVSEGNTQASVRMCRARVFSMRGCRPRVQPQAPLCGWSGWSWGVDPAPIDTLADIRMRLREVAPL